MKRGTGKIVVPAVVLAAAAAAIMLWQPWGAAEPALTRQQAEQQLLARYEGRIESAKLANGRYDMRLRTDAGLYAVALSAADGRIESIDRLETAAQQKPEILGRARVKALLENRAGGADVDKLELQTPTGSGGPVYLAELTDGAGRAWKLTLDAYSGVTLTEEAIAAGSDTPASPVPDPSPGPGRQPEKDPASPGEPSGGKPDDSGKPGGGDNKPRPPDSDGPVRLLSEKQAEKIAEQALADAGTPIEDSDADLRTEDDGQAYYLVEVELEDGREASVQVHAVSGAVLSTTWDKDDDT